MTHDLVDNAALREAVLASRIPLTEVARRIGYGQSRRRARDGHVRLRRMLGLSYTVYSHAQRSKTGTRTTRQSRLSYNNALKIAEAIGVDPVDLGL